MSKEDYISNFVKYRGDNRFIKWSICAVKVWIWKAVVAFDDNPRVLQALLDWILPDDIQNPKNLCTSLFSEGYWKKWKAIEYTLQVPKEYLDSDEAKLLFWSLLINQIMGIDCDEQKIGHCERFWLFLSFHLMSRNLL